MKVSKYNINRQKFILLKMYICLAVRRILPSLSLSVILDLDPVNISPINVYVINIHESICPQIHD